VGLDTSWEKVLREKGLLDAEPATETQISAQPRAGSIATVIPHRVQIVLWMPGLATKSEANVGGKNSTKFSRKKHQRDTVLSCLPLAVSAPHFRVPTRVRLIRVGSRRLDSDNLQSAFKAIRDAVASWLGVDDGDYARVRWSYSQRPGYVSGVKIIIG
jgi:hypothetical protein